MARAWIGLALALTAAPCAGQTTAVFVDNFGKVVGPVQLPNQVIVVIAGRAMHIAIADDGGFLLEAPPMLFSGPDCKGDAYIPPSSTLRGDAPSAMLPRAYVMGPTARDTVLIYPDAVPGPFTPTKILNPDDPQCRDYTLPVTAAKAVTVPIANLGVKPPFTVQVR